MVSPIYILILSLAAGFLLSIIDRGGRKISLAVFYGVLAFNTALIIDWTYRFVFLHAPTLVINTAGFSAPVSINLELGMRYEKWENAPFYITDTTVALHNKFTILYDDYDMVAINAGLSYHLNEKWNVIFGADYFVYNTMNLLSAWHKPSYDIKLIADYNIGNKFLLHGKLVYNGSTTTPEYNTSGNTTVISIGNINGWFDASLGIEYRYRKKLGIFLNFNNITATHYYRWYNYPSYGFNIIGGLSYTF
jgi:outer membrane receptor protein involved in Fe transport